MVLRRFAVFANFESVALTEKEARALVVQRAVHLQVISRADPLKIWATVAAASIAEAIGILEREVERVAPGAMVTRVNGIEVFVERPLAAVGAPEAS